MGYSVAGFGIFMNGRGEDDFARLPATAARLYNWLTRAKALRERRKGTVTNPRRPPAPHPPPRSPAMSPTTDIILPIPLPAHPIPPRQQRPHPPRQASPHPRRIRVIRADPWQIIALSAPNRNYIFLLTSPAISATYRSPARAHSRPPVQAAGGEFQPRHPGALSKPNTPSRFARTLTHYALRVTYHESRLTPAPPPPHAANDTHTHPPAPASSRR